MNDEYKRTLEDREKEILTDLLHFG